MDKRPIGIFDSGLGGLTCVKEVLRLMPNENVIYFGDTGRVPYGSKGRDTIVKYTRQNIKFLRRFDVKYIIIACGTASSAALPMIEKDYETEIEGVVKPASDEAVAATKNKKIAVLGTAGTVRSGKYAEVIARADKSVAVLQKACPMFVPLVENGYTSGKITEEIAREYLEPVIEFGADTIILGCTHYPILEKVISGIVGEGVTLINSGAAAARHTKKRLAELDMLGDEGNRGSVRYFVSDMVEGFAELGGMFLEREIGDSIEYIDIDGVV